MKEKEIHDIDSEARKDAADRGVDCGADRATRRRVGAGWPASAGPAATVMRPSSGIWHRPPCAPPTGSETRRRRVRRARAPLRGQAARSGVRLGALMRHLPDV
jgi:hypothetical protein